jgi:hypothetical protein
LRVPNLESGLFKRKSYISANKLNSKFGGKNNEKESNHDIDRPVCPEFGNHGLCPESNECCIESHRGGLLCEKRLLPDERQTGKRR